MFFFFFLTGDWAGGTALAKLSHIHMFEQTNFKVHILYDIIINIFKYLNK